MTVAGSSYGGEGDDYKNDRGTVRKSHLPADVFAVETGADECKYFMVEQMTSLCPYSFAKAPERFLK